MSGSFTDDGKLDITDGVIVSIFGKKKSGKSVLALVLFDGYPSDRVVIDVNQDDGPFDPDIIDMTWDDDLRWPEWRRNWDGDRWHPMTVRFRPDPGRQETFLAECDDIIRFTMLHARKLADQQRVGCALLIHEIGLVAPVHKTTPWMRRLLMSNRHYRTTLIAAGPRPKGIDTLVLAQSNVIYMFELLNPADRQILAESIGWSPRELSAEFDGLLRHEYLRFDADEAAPATRNQEDTRLLHFPPLPPSIVRSVLP